MRVRSSREASQILQADRWRSLRLTKAQSGGSDGRRAEDQYREERHDALAKTIFATTPVEQRQHRSARELRAMREEQRQQWTRRQQMTPRRKPRRY